MSFKLFCKSSEKKSQSGCQDTVLLLLNLSWVWAKLKLCCILITSYSCCLGKVKSHMPTAASHAPRIEPLTDLHPSLTLQGVRMERGHGSRCSKQARAPSVHSRFGISVSGPPTTPESTLAANHVHGISKVRRRWVYFGFPAPRAGADTKEATWSVLFDTVYPPL